MTVILFKHPSQYLETAMEHVKRCKEDVGYMLFCNREYGLLSMEDIDDLVTIEAEMRNSLYCLGCDEWDDEEDFIDPEKEALSDKEQFHLLDANLNNIFRFFKQDIDDYADRLEFYDSDGILHSLTRAVEASNRLLLRLFPKIESYREWLVIYNERTDRLGCVLRKTFAWARRGSMARRLVKAKTYGDCHILSISPA